MESGHFLLVSVFPGIHSASESVFEGFVLDKIIIFSAPAAWGEIPNLTNPNLKTNPNERFLGLIVNFGFILTNLIRIGCIKFSGHPKVANITRTISGVFF